MSVSDIIQIKITIILKIRDIMIQNLYSKSIINSKNLIQISLYKCIANLP